MITLISSRLLLLCSRNSLNCKCVKNILRQRTVNDFSVNLVIEGIGKKENSFELEIKVTSEIKAATNGYFTQHIMKRF